MSRGFYQYLQKQYGNVVASGRGQCVFVSADDESAFRQTADEFVSDMSLTRVVRIRMYPDDIRSPFSLVQAILKSLIDITGKDIEKLINPSMLKSYEYSLLKSFYFGKPLPQTVRKLAIFRVLVRQSTHFLPYEKSGISAGFLDQFDCKKERQTDPSFSSRGRIFR